MPWNLTEAITYYKSLGAPQDQSVLIELLREVQKEQGGGIPRWTVSEISTALGAPESLLAALIRRIPSLRMADTHLLEICCGSNCSRRADFACAAEKYCSSAPGKVTLRCIGCMRMCGKGPNIRWDGTLYNHADEALIQKLISEII